jgi:hypothetical protein
MEMKVTLREVLSRVSVRAPEAASEKVKLHNVTLMPAKQARIVVTGRRTRAEARPADLAAHA